MYIVYWSEVHEDGLEAKSRPFLDEDLSPPLDFMAELRARQYSDGSVRFVVMSSENPNQVGKAGATAAGPDYDWSKQHRAGAKPSRGDLSHTKDH